MATNSSSNPIYGGTYELSSVLERKLFNGDEHYDDDGIYHKKEVDYKKQWRRDIMMSIEDSDVLSLNLFSQAPDDTSEEIYSVIIDKSNRKDFILYLKEVVQMLERNKKID